MEKSKNLPDLTLLKNFRQQKVIKRVKVRVLRTWRPWDYYNTKKDGDAIHAFVTEDYYPKLECIMEVGHIYDIIGFHTNKDNLSNVKIANHEYDLLFTTYTQYLHVSEDLPSFPDQTYDHLDFLDFKATRTHKVYPDVYGCVKSVFMGETFMKLKNRVEPKCDVILQNLRREQLRITFWNKNAESFNLTPFLEAEKPIFAMVTTLISTLFGDEPVASANNHTCVIINPHVQEEHLYKQEFSKPGDKVKVTQNLNIPNHETNKRISELYLLDQNKYKSKTLHCTAWIKEISLSQSWYKMVCSYKGCYKDLYDEESNSYRIRVVMNDEEGEIVGVIQGEQAERMLGTKCRDLLEEIGLTEKFQPPHIIKELAGHQYHFSFTLQFGRTPTPYIKHMERITEPHPINPTPEKKKKKRSLEKEMWEGHCFHHLQKKGQRVLLMWEKEARKQLCFRNRKTKRLNLVRCFRNRKTKRLNLVLTTLFSYALSRSEEPLTKVLNLFL